jgi:hypothetical protein
VFFVTSSRWPPALLIAPAGDARSGTGVRTDLLRMGAREELRMLFFGTAILTRLEGCGTSSGSYWAAAN